MPLVVVDLARGWYRVGYHGDLGGSWSRAVSEYGVYLEKVFCSRSSTIIRCALPLRPVSAVSRVNRNVKLDPGTPIFDGVSGWALGPLVFLISVKPSLIAEEGSPMV